MKDVGFLDVIELIARSNEVAYWEATIRQVIKEHGIRNQHGHRHNLPAGHGQQRLVDALKRGNATSPQIKSLQTIDKSLTRAPRQQALLTLEQLIPQSIFVDAVSALLRLEPVVTKMARPLQRRHEHGGRRRRDSTEVELGHCRLVSQCGAVVTNGRMPSSVKTREGSMLRP